MNNLRQIFCILLIACGAILDAYFYAFRFLADGTILPVAILAALALELLLAFAVWNAQHSKVYAGVAIAVSIYAIVQTSAGQTFSLISRDALAGDTTKTTSALMDIDKQSLARLDDEYATINRQMKSITTTADRAAYAGTLNAMTRRLNDLTRERLAVSTALSAKAKDAADSEKAKIRLMSIYDFYASIPEWGGKDWLKFLFHTVLSIFISLMTPIGILSWNRRQAVRRTRGAPISRKEVDTFVTYAWEKVRAGIGDYILNERAFNERLDQYNITYPLGVYSELVKRCYNLRIVDRDLRAVVTNEELIKEKVFRMGSAA